MGPVKYPVLSWISCVKGESDKLDSEARRGYNLSLSSFSSLCLSFINAKSLVDRRA